MRFVLLINVKMPKIHAHEKSFITSGSVGIMSMQKERLGVGGVAPSGLKFFVSIGKIKASYSRGVGHYLACSSHCPWSHVVTTIDQFKYL